jgi:transcriptional accessory protein Tex/SPT6
VVLQDGDDCPADCDCSAVEGVNKGETIECRVLSVDPAEQRLSLSLKALTKGPEADADAGEAASEEDAPPEKPRKKRTGPLKGGVSGLSEGARFGLKW